VDGALHERSPVVSDSQADNLFNVYFGSIATVVVLLCANVRESDYSVVLATVCVNRDTVL